MALKIVYPICCGIDIHKTIVVACIASTNSKEVTTYKRYRFSTYTKGLRELSQWLLTHHCFDDCATFIKKQTEYPWNEKLRLNKL